MRLGTVTRAHTMTTLSGVHQSYAHHNGAVFFGVIGMAPTSDATNDTPRRPLMALLAGERPRSLADLLASTPTPASNATSTAAKKRLRTYNGLGYVSSAPHKTGAGVETRIYTRRHKTPKAYFLLSVICVILWRGVPYIRRVYDAALMGSSHTMPPIMARCMVVLFTAGLLCTHIAIHRAAQ